jgi:hypothetical protein
MRTDRLETFADGVLAIAATLLILNVDTQSASARPTWRTSLLEIWPSYAGYAVSFLTIGIIWVKHHNLMAQVDRADRIFLFLNVFLLMVVAFIPFPTRLVASTSGRRREGGRGGLRRHADRHRGDVQLRLVLCVRGGGRLLAADHDPKASRASRAATPARDLPVMTLVAFVEPVAACSCTEGSRSSG